MCGTDGERTELTVCGTNIFTQNCPISSKIGLKVYFNYQDFKIYMVNLHTSYIRFHIMLVYRAPSGDFNLFFNGLNYLIKSIYKTKSNLNIYGDINMTTSLKIIGKTTRLNAANVQFNCYCPCSQQNTSGPIF